MKMLKNNLFCLCLLYIHQYDERGEMDHKTINVLENLHRDLLKRDLLEGNCSGCHFKKIEWKESTDEKEGYCSLQCQIGYHSLLKPFYQIGQKRVRELKVERPDFRQLLELLDEGVVAQIITYTYPNYRKSAKDMKYILSMRKESLQLKELIDQYILKPIERLSKEITDQFYDDTLELFPNLRVLKVNQDIADVSVLDRLSRLERLEITGNVLDDDSIRSLQRLTKLVMIQNFGITSRSISRLTNLKSLLILDNDVISDQDLSTFPPSIKSLSLIECSEIRDTGLLSLSRLTRLKALELNTIQGSDQGFQGLTRLKNFRIVLMDGFIGNSDSLGNMPLLESLVVMRCPKFEGNGLRYKSPLKLFIAADTLISDSTLSSQIHLETLDISNTSITDERLGELTNLKRLSMRLSTHITDKSLSTLTRLEFLDISGSRLITRKSLSQLTNLTELYLIQTIMLPTKNDRPLPLHKLRVLIAGSTSAIANRDMIQFSNLTNLSLADNSFISGSVYLRNLTNLTKLDLKYNLVIENDDISKFTKLEEIDLTGNRMITSDALRGMSFLKKITLSDGTVTDDPNFVGFASTRGRRG